MEIMMNIKSVPCKSAISRSSLPGLAYTFNPYVGCCHGCLYCYVPDALRGRVSSLDWGREVFVKQDVLVRLKADLKHLRPGMVGVSTVTDPYQEAEKSLEITRGALEILKASGFPASIQTKSCLVRRDLDLMKDGKFELGMTITSLDEEFQRLFEPGASPPTERAKTIEVANSMGISTWIFFGPIIPSFNDSAENIEAVVLLAKRTRSRILYDRLNLKPLIRQRMKRCISEDVISSMNNYNFTNVFRKIEEECSKQQVKCAFAF